MTHIHRWTVLCGIAKGSALLLVVLVLSAVPRQNEKKGHPLSIQKNGQFRAENGLFFAEPGRIHLYSQVPKSVNEKGEPQLTPLHDELLSAWKGEAYYHDAYTLKDGKWERDRREFSEEPDMFLDFAPCDPLNQLNVSSRYSLPANLRDSAKVKVKDVTEIAGPCRFALVVYSDTPSLKVAYSLRVAIVADGAHGQVVGVQPVSLYGYFCGARVLQSKLANGEPVSVLLVYVDEPAASSNYIAVYSFLIGRVGAPGK
jgi:hypothetical protein